jgi:hypothetical protein
VKLRGVFDEHRDGGYIYVSMFELRALTTTTTTRNGGIGRVRA